jgi:hypothetical protein
LETSLSENSQSTFDLARQQAEVEKALHRLAGEGSAPAWIVAAMRKANVEAAAFLREQKKPGELPHFIYAH